MGCRGVSLMTRLGPDFRTAQTQSWPRVIRSPDLTMATILSCVFMRNITYYRLLHVRWENAR